MNDNPPVEIEPGGYALAQPENVLDTLENTLDNFLATASVDAVYGEPIVHGEHLIIPAAEVVSVMGFGIGYGGGGAAEEDNGSGGGGGGGGRVFSRAVAVVVASPEGVRVEPVVDRTKIALAAFTAGAFIVGMMFRLFKPEEAYKDLKEG